MCMEAQAEKLKLKRRSMDIEKQLQTYLEEKEKLQESIVQGRLKIHHEKVLTIHDSSVGLQYKVYS